MRFIEVFTEQDLKKSVLVVAHPDDENLWFSSVLGKVAKVIICFKGNPNVPERAAARDRVFAQYPLSTIECLGLDTSLTFGSADWAAPKETKYGLAVNQNKAAYKENYLHLLELLTERLSGFDYVFTHNPWGEYGHEEHVQIHRVVSAVAEKQGATVWFSNYASQQTAKLASYYMHAGDLNHQTIGTNIPLAEQIRDIYLKENCWTAPNDHKWFETESFGSLNLGNGESNARLNLFPINLLTWPGPVETIWPHKITPTAVPQKYDTDSWVFVVGCYNSGTTLLEALINQHSDIACLPQEGQHLTEEFITPLAAGLPRLWALKPELFVMGVDSHAADAEQMRIDWAPHFSDINSPVKLEKSCPNAGRTRWLQKHFPNSKFIGIVRNGYAVAEGISRKAGHALDLSAQQWARSNQIMLEDFNYLDNALLISYEDLSESPQRVMETIWGFLDMEPPSVDVDQSYKIHGKESRIENMNHKSFVALDDQMIAEIEAAASTVLDYFGYRLE
jgi:LmbE family N-acetylglucosaminyl deacetylase